MDTATDHLGGEVPLLLEAIHDGVVEIRFNVAELNTPGRPTHSYRDNWLVLGSPVVMGLLFVPVAWWLAIGFFLTGLIYSARLGRPWMFRRCMRRAMQLLEDDHRFFDGFWRDGMFMLVHLPTGDTCPAREGDVRGFIRAHLAGPAAPEPEA
jgi:hypothetical protein